MKEYTLISVDEQILRDGRYLGRSPLQAARKAFNKYCQKFNLDDCSVKFVIQETTPDSQCKKFSFLGVREKLSEPRKIERKNGDVYWINYDTRVNRHRE